MIAVDLVSDCGEVMRYKMRYTRKYLRNQSHNAGTFGGVLVSVLVVTQGTLRVVSVGEKCKEQRRSKRQPCLWNISNPLAVNGCGEIFKGVVQA